MELPNERENRILDEINYKRKISIRTTDETREKE